MHRIQQVARRLAAAALTLAAPALAAQAQGANGPGPLPIETEAPSPPKTPQDHRQYKELQGPFHLGSEVTRACLRCHTQAAHQVQSTLHWTWKAWDPQRGRMVGKSEIYNTFCVSPISNEQFCTVCHVGYGSTDPSKFVPFDQRGEEQVDCLVCHDQTRTYRKIPFIGGNPATTRIAVRPGCNEVYGTDRPYVDPIDLTAVARSVRAPKRENCGACHFYGGGGDGVKHGDLDSSMAAPSHALDVHMDAKGLDFPCQKCHEASDHHISGHHYTIDARPEKDARMRGSPSSANAASCQSCHGQRPHKGHDLLSAAAATLINRHTDAMACPTCHIPAFARGGIPTKMDWNYATAGKLGPNGSPLVVNDAKGRNSYWGVKGSFSWDENVVPEYRWFNGEEQWTLIGEKAAPGPDGTVHVNEIFGSAKDGRSRIWPFKISRNHQPYDPKNQVLAVFHSFGFDPEAFTMTYDWPTAIRAGMKAARVPYSGSYEFVRTEMYWPIAHMVAPKEQALTCDQCHSAGGRLDRVPDVYIAGRPRDQMPAIERAGSTLTALALGGVLLHALVRIALWTKRRGRGLKEVP